MGVWIETRCLQHHNGVDGVTPCMGVWIETTGYAVALKRTQSHTLYGCVD